ncbi:MAG TPA: hypothetical protein VFE47_04495 [Tepidisphaeraceae bacterium]|jgi:hypothetical protein|nr:hypothetical protein [Tepidisphaeraceae bacterium]
MRKIVFLMCLGGALAVSQQIASAVSTSYWRQANTADFKAGTLENVVATNLGDLKLSRAVKTLLEEDPKISSVNALAEAPDGSIYAGTGPHGMLLQIKDEKVSTIATLPDAAVLSLVVEKNGAIIIGTGGQAGRVLRIDKPGNDPKTLFEADGVQYIWGLAQTPDGNIYAATGPNGALYEIKPDGSKRTILETNESNILSLISDGKDLLYLGTDPHGLVYRVNRKTGESFVLFNAAEAEVSALALDKAGNLYAGTAEAKEEPQTPQDNAQPAEKGGRPEGGAIGVPIPADRPKEPTPPPPPNPNPGQPDPIPKSPAQQSELHVQSLMAKRAVAVAESQSLRFAPRRMDMHNVDFSRRPMPFEMMSDAVAPVMLAFDVAGADDPPPDDSPKKKRPRPTPGDPNPGPNPNPNPRPGKPDANPQTAPAPAVHAPTVDTTTGPEARPEGNAIYKIDPDGFVTEIFRQPVLILSMVENNGTLLVATGGAEGQIYQLRPSADETVVLAKVDPKEIMCLLSARDGKVYMGTANVGTLAAMSSGFAARGTYASPVLDATQISRFGKIHLHGALPAGTGITVATRSGNVKDADEKTWSKWSDEAPAAEFLQVMSPSARFLQYRVTFTSTEGKATPVVGDVSIAYQVPNLPPQIKAVKIATTGSAGSGAGTDVAAMAAPDADAAAAASHHIESARRQTIAWDASDPNNDTLTYSLYLRAVGESGWILLKDKLTDATYDWDTRTVADGRYEVKVIASDASSNPPGQGKTASRVSDPLTVDNTPPVIGDVKSQQRGADVHIDLKVVDHTSTVASVDYAVDSTKDWQFVLPTDQIYDSPEETVSFSIPGLKAGQHQITLRATDSKGNQSFENLYVNVQGGAAAAVK